ncbi:MAG: hypothetical protein ACT4PT_06150 [Methanobacteriota archaeon]
MASYPPEGAFIQRRLEKLVGQEVVIVMMDQRAFRGTVTEFGHNWLLLRDVTEGSTINTKGWEEVAIAANLAEKHITDRGVFMEEKTPPKLVRLKDALINLGGVLRIWEWSPDNLAVPEHVHIDTKSARRGGAVF